MAVPADPEQGPRKADTVSGVGIYTSSVVFFERSLPTFEVGFAPTEGLEFR